MSGNHQEVSVRTAPPAFVKGLKFVLNCSLASMGMLVAGLWYSPIAFFTCAMLALFTEPSEEITPWVFMLGTVLATLGL